MIKGRGSAIDNIYHRHTPGQIVSSPQNPLLRSPNHLVGNPAINRV